MKKLHVIPLVLGSVFFGSAQATPVQWELGSGGNGHWYDVVQLTSTWDEADLDVGGLTLGNKQGYLATPTSDAENQFIWDSFSSTWANDTYGYWLGGYRYDTGTPVATDENWAWVSDEAWDYTNWANGEPNNVDGDEDHIHFFKTSSPAKWNDQHNGASVGGYIVEYDDVNVVPVPAAVWMFGTGLLGLVGMKRKLFK